MQFAEIYRSRRPVISFELFPPKTDEAEQHLFEVAIPAMLRLNPAFITCTYGAAGGTRDRTLGIVSRLRRDFGVEAVSHLTCVGHSREDIAHYLDRIKAEGVHNLVALRGDPPRGDDTFRPHPDGFAYANQLVGFIRERGDFGIAVAGYPEGHPEASDKRQDWDRCAAKVEAGADVIITQLFYNNQDFFEFEDYLRNKRGVKVPVTPGVLPILSGAQIKRFCGLCGACLPKAVIDKLDSYGDDSESARKYGVELATQMCAELLSHGVSGFHFYTLNRDQSTAEILRNLGLVPTATTREAPSTNRPASASSS